MPDVTATEALSAAAVTKRFGGLVAVENMSFHLAEKEVLGLIGPNGSGKTTMMNLISGALKPSSGEIKLYGDAIAGIGASRVAHKGVARTFQLVRMLPAMTVIENVAAGGVFGHARRWGKELDDHAHALLRRVGLPNAGSAPVSALTYIDQKRVELARALASDPKILLLDEWLAGLNPTELKIGIALIEQLRREGCTIIVVEHVMHAIRSLCDRCIVMNSGAKIAEGTPAEVLADHEVIRAYLGVADA
ncbi:MAG: ABC transporter ATP-binding protein [Xanthobacteraceae bacterium]|jgi:branched-chain amino acid transport system ATP-binding protein